MMLPRGRGVDLRELLEDEIVMVRGDSDPGVADFRPQRATIGVRVNPDPSAWRRELDGVPDEIAEHVRDLLAVGKNRWQFWRDVQVQPELLFDQQWLAEASHLRHDVGERERRRRKRELIRC